MVNPGATRLAAVSCQAKVHPGFGPEGPNGVFFFFKAGSGTSECTCRGIASVVSDCGGRIRHLDQTKMKNSMDHRPIAPKR